MRQHHKALLPTENRREERGEGEGAGEREKNQRANVVASEVRKFLHRKQNLYVNARVYIILEAEV